jgi:hypothetical protein
MVILSMRQVLPAVPAPAAEAVEASSVALVDLNRDGNLDLIVPQDGPYFTRAMSVFLGRGDGTFGTPSDYAMNLQPNPAAIADFDGDGAADVATVGIPSRIAVRGGLGDGLFGPATFFTAGMWGPLIAADFNSDGRPDLAATGLFGANLFLNWTGLQTPQCAVPALTHKRHQAATRAIDGAGCSVGRSPHRYSRDVARNRVIAQRPPRGSVLASHGRVDLVISLGARR